MSGIGYYSDFWYAWALSALSLKQVEEKYDKDINKSIMEFSDKVIKHNYRIIELSERINALNGDVLNDNKILIDELKRRNNKWKHSEL